MPWWSSIALGQERRLGLSAEIEQQLEQRLAAMGQGWAAAIVIDPELETWVFSDSPHVDKELGWEKRQPPLRQALESQGFWPAGQAKPPDPKAAFAWALQTVRKPVSSSIFRQLGKLVSLRRCEDRSFLRLQHLLQDWFPARPGADR